MLELFNNSIQEAITRLDYQATTYLPLLLAFVMIVFAAYIAALLSRWLIYKVFKGFSVDRFLRETGIAHVLAPSGHLQATRIAAETAFWSILLIGFLLGLSAFGSGLSTQIAQGIESMLPKLFIAILILVGGIWLSHFLGRSALVWSVNESLPSPRRIATGVRTLVMFAAVVVAADQLHFARTIFLAAFIIVIGGAVFTASLVIGLRYGIGRQTFEDEKHKAEESAERSLWSHL